VSEHGADDPECGAVQEVLVCVDQPGTKIDALIRWWPVAIFAAMGVIMVTAPTWVRRPVETMDWVFVCIGVVPLIASALIARHILNGKDRRIEVDFARRTVTFENFRIARVFTSGLVATPRAVFGFDEILGVQLLRNPRAMDILYIITPAGRVSLNETATNFLELKLALEKVSVGNPKPLFVYTVGYQWLVGTVAFVIAMAICAVVARKFGLI
jgi:hypothetical protein